MSDDAPIVVNGWTLYMHPLFAAQYVELQTQVEALKSKDPKGIEKKTQQNALQPFTNWLSILSRKTRPIMNTGKVKRLARIKSIGLELSFFNSIVYFLDIMIHQK